MKTIRKMTVIWVVGLSLGVTLNLTGCTKSEEMNQEALSQSNKDSYNYTETEKDLLNVIDSMPLQDLSEAEKAALMVMREEEYLAHDVYDLLGKMYSRRVFLNIIKSEDRHTDAVKALIEKYGLTDPALNHVQGVFNNAELQSLYNNLIAKGSESLLQALVVGATIEDVDIYDLEKHLEVTDNEDIKMVFQNLMRGSRNHLRAFYRNILSEGGSYTPQYISVDLFNEIINSEHERN